MSPHASAGRLTRKSPPPSDIAGVTTTSGLSWKIPGRAGDSPILGAGQYVANEVGAAGSTGRGEAKRTRIRSANERDDAGIAGEFASSTVESSNEQIPDLRSTNRAPIAPLTSLVLGGAIGTWIGTFAMLLGFGPEATAFVAVFCGFLVPVAVIAAIVG